MIAVTLTLHLPGRRETLNLSLPDGVVVREALAAVGLADDEHVFTVRDACLLYPDEPLEPSIFQKISMFCNVKPDCVIENITLPCLYEAPLMLEQSNFSSVVCRELGIDAPAPKLTEWEHMVERIKHADRRVTIGLVGKYVHLHDAYLSVAEALRHAGYALGAEVDIRWIDSETITESDAEAVLGLIY